MAPTKAPEQKPVLACDDCRGLTYYGPAPAPQQDPRVAMASVIAKAATAIAGIAVGGNVATSISSDLAAGAIPVVLQGATNTSVSDTRVTEVTDLTDISDTSTSVTNTSVTDTNTTSDTQIVP